jgi:hypothetical protein
VQLALGYLSCSVGIYVLAIVGDSSRGQRGHFSFACALVYPVYHRWLSVQNKTK